MSSMFRFKMSSMKLKLHEIRCMQKSLKIGRSLLLLLPWPLVPAEAEEAEVEAEDLRSSAWPHQIATVRTVCPLRVLSALLILMSPAASAAQARARIAFHHSKKFVRGLRFTPRSRCKSVQTWQKCF